VGGEADKVQYRMYPHVGARPSLRLHQARWDRRQASTLLKVFPMKGYANERVGASPSTAISE